MRRERDEVEGDERENAVCDVIPGEIGETACPDLPAWSCRSFLLVKFGPPVGVRLEERAQMRFILDPLEGRARCGLPP